MKGIFNAPPGFAEKAQTFGFALLLIGSISAIAAAVEPITATVLFSALTTFCGTVLTIWASVVLGHHADQQISSARARADEADTRSEQAQQQLARLRAPRSLSAEQASAVAADVTDYRGQQFSGLVANAAADAQPLWGQVVATLQSAGWQLANPRGLAVGNPPAGVSIAPGTGITIFAPVQGSHTTRQAADALYHAFQKQGLVVLRENHNESGRNAIIVVEIGTRPL